MPQTLGAIAPGDDRRWGWCGTLVAAIFSARRLTKGKENIEFAQGVDTVDPSGKRVASTNLAELCRENGLHPVKMHNRKSGKIQRYKGWTWSNEDEQA